MSFFDFFRTKKIEEFDRKKASYNSKSLKNPSVFFSSLGPTMNNLWQNIVEGQNRAVDIFSRYLQFCNSLSKQYSNIDFLRPIEIHFSNNDISFTVGELMYLYCLNLKEDIYITKEYDISNVFLLSFHNCEELFMKFTDCERTYITELKTYLEKNIKQLCSDVSIRRFDVDFVKSALPVNTLECVKYHQFLADVDIHGTYKRGEKWNRITNAPITGSFGRVTKQDKPLILVNIEHIDSLVLDYICYATIALPTLDMDKVLTFRNPTTNKNVLNTIDETMGEGASIFADRAITDMNSAAFRQWVRMGLKTR